MSLHHVGIICRSRDQAYELLDRLNLEVTSVGYVAEYEATCIFAGQVEFIVPDPGSKLAGFNRGAGGIHHIALAVNSLVAETERLLNLSIPVVEEAPVRGAGDFWLNFVHPVYTGGIILELVEPD